MNFREELSLIKERKLQEEDSTIEGKILKHAIIPYIEKRVSAEQLTKGVVMTVYHCDRQLLIVIGTDVVHKEDFMDAKDTSVVLNALKSRLEAEGFEISDVTLYRYLVTIKV